MLIYTVGCLCFSLQLRSQETTGRWRCFADEIGDEQLRKILQTMQQAIIKPGTSWHGRELLKVLQGIRHRGTQSTMSHYSDLPLLNPGP